MNATLALTWDVLSIGIRRVMFLALTASLALASGGLVYVLGLWSLLIPVYAGIIAAIVVSPRWSAVVLVAVGVALEPNMFDFTKYVGDAVFQMPPGWENSLGFTVSPFEVALVLTAVSAMFHPGQSLPRPPLVLWFTIAAIGLGIVYGLDKGGDPELVYHEVRGLVFGAAAFVIAVRLGESVARPAIGAILLATAALAVVALARYFVYVRDGSAPVPVEFAYAHESPLLLAIGMVIAVVLLARGVRGWQRLGLLLYMALIFCAIIVTGRRAGTLVLLLGAGSIWLVLLPRRPVMMVTLGVVGAVAMTAYLAAYWNQDYGATAQPARAIRSQIDPSPRDESSDTYRTVERANVLKTLEYNRVFGVGFGRPFIAFEPLPDLTGFWPLQYYTPHQNILWLWLKLGIFGAAAFLALIAVALRKGISAVYMLPQQDGRWALSAVVFATIVMYLGYASVDLALVGTRSIAPLAAAVGLALTLPASWPRGKIASRLAQRHLRVIRGGRMDDD